MSSQSGKLRTFTDSFSRALSTTLSLATLLFAIAFAPSAHPAAPRHVAQSTPQPTSAQPALPPPGAYAIDPDHTFVYFGAWHQIVGLVRGRFDKTTGTITVSQNLADCAVDVTIDTSTIDTQVAERDADLRGPAFFDVKNFPAMTYKGRGIHRSGDAWALDGSLTIRGITVAVPLTLKFNGLFVNQKPGTPARAAFHATAATKRGDFDMVRDNRMELGAHPGPAPDVSIEIDVEADATFPSQH
jgi:polyisoprenoid-binding protein YceI